MPNGFVTNYILTWRLWPSKNWSVKFNERCNDFLLLKIWTKPSWAKQTKSISVLILIKGSDGKVRGATLCLCTRDYATRWGECRNLVETIPISTFI